MDGVDKARQRARAGLYDAADVARPNEAFPHAGRRKRRPAVVSDVDAELRLIDDEEEEAHGGAKRVQRVRPDERATR